MTKRKFYKTTVSVVVLSEEPIPSYASLKDILEEAYSGDYVAGGMTAGCDDTRHQEVLDGKQAADALTALGSVPAFFRLNEEGDDEP